MNKEINSRIIKAIYGSNVGTRGAQSPNKDAAKVKELIAQGVRIKISELWEVDAALGRKPLQIVLAQYVKTYGVTSRNRQELMWLAILAGRINLLKQCVKAGCDINRNRGNNWNLLELATVSGENQIATFLIESGAKAA